MAKKKDGWILEEALELTTGDRNNDYGHPLDDYTKTAKMVSGLLADKLKEDLIAEDVIKIMCLVKLSREQHRPKDDNIIDLAGYASCLDMTKRERESRK